MRLVVWNCRQAFDEKFDFFLRTLRPDVAVVPECAAPEVQKARVVYHWPTVSGRVWNGGDNRNKGLALFTFGDFKIREWSFGPPEANYIQASISGPMSAELVAMWAQGPRHGERVRAALDAHRDALASGRGVLAGDLNNSVVFDRPRSRHHANVVERLRTEFEMVSAYHTHFGEAQGAETRPTHRHNLKKNAFHIDYAFVPVTWTAGATVAVGDEETWGRRSDHFPLVLDVVAAGETQTEAG